MDCLTLPHLCECDGTREEHRNKNKKKLMYSRIVIYTDCRRVAAWTVTLTINLTPNPKSNHKEGKKGIFLT